MGSRGTHSDEPQRERQRAEEIARVRANREPENARDVSPEAVKKLLYDLRVHQIELEMQNEELRRAQDEIENARARYFDLYDLAPVGYLTLSQQGMVLEANLTASDLLGVPRDRLVKVNLSKFIVAADQDIYFRLRRRIFEARTAQVCEMRLVKGDGTSFWVRLQASAPHEAPGGSAFRAVLSDVTARKGMEETLRASENRHRLLFEKSHDALVTLAPPTWGVASINLAAVAMFGARDQSDFISRPALHYSPARQPDGRASSEKARNMLDIAMREGSHFFKWTFQRMSGEEFAATVLLTRMEIDGRPLLQATVRDETEMKKLQVGLAQADRLASMGMLAAGVAHEINNPLTYVIYNAETLAEDLRRIGAAATRCGAALRGQVGNAEYARVAGNDAAMLDPARIEEAVGRAGEVLDGAVRIRDIARALGTFSRVEQTQQSMVEVNDAIERAIAMALNEIRFRATLVKDLGPVPAVWASEGRLSQVFLNLLINAARAIEEGDIEGNRITVRSWVETGEVFVEVNDTGRGILQENLSRLFEPFFTTRSAGLGSGLGLAICKTIIADFGGDIRVASEVGKGTRFVVQLPIPGDRSEAPRAQDDRESTMVAPGRGRILVIDDEELVLRTLKRLLTPQHEVITASGGEAGRAILERDQSFDVIVCDLMMPDMTGMDLHAWLVRRFPALAGQMVFLSGGAFTPKASQYLDAVPNLKLSKPLDSAKFQQVMASLVALSMGARAQK